MFAVPFVGTIASAFGKIGAMHLHIVVPIIPQNGRANPLLFELMSLPPYSPELNIVEGLWGWLNFQTSNAPPSWEDGAYRNSSVVDPRHRERLFAQLRPNVF
jgi:hypothetical protein